MTFAPHALSFGSGFISLSQEILWVRLVGFAYGNPPQVFAAVLGLYLLGIAAGAHIGKRYCREGGDLYGVAGRVLLLSAAWDAAAPFLYVGAMKLGATAGLLVLVPSVVLVALFKSIVFPIAHHLGSADSVQHVGASVSRVYFANILGSTLGPLVTGFWLLEHATLQQSFVLMCAATVMLATFCFVVRGAAARWAIAAAPLPVLAGLLLPSTLVPVLIAQAWYPVAEQSEPGVIAVVRENRHGIVHIMSDGKGPDTMWGGNVYDGRVNTGLANDVNGIQRVYILAALQPAHARVLEIGVSIGAWTRVLSGFPQLQHLDAVELNPAYPELIARYPQVNPVLRDPRVTLHIDDGRRWLKRHPETRFDLIVMNTTFHWRAYSSLLLSREFMQRAKAHLNPGGVVAFNTTESVDAYATAASVFAHVYRLGSFAYASDRDLAPELAHLEAQLGAVRWGDVAAVDLADPAVQVTLAGMREGFGPPDEFIAKAGRAPEVITEQNMLTEYRYGNRFW